MVTYNAEMLPTNQALQEENWVSLMLLGIIYALNQ